LENRLNRLASILSESELESILVSSLKDIRWLTGFSGSNALLYSDGVQHHFLTDRRYADSVQEEVSNASIHIYQGGSLFDELNRLGIIPDAVSCLVQSDDLTLSSFEDLNQIFPKASFRAESAVFTKMRELKDDIELDNIRRAQLITDEVFLSLLEIIKPGVSEREIAAEIRYKLVALGAEKCSFDPIVASGPNSALPHARPSDKTLEMGEAVLLDYGCVVNGYCSDMTRTISLGNAGPEFAKVHQTVLDAMRAAIDHVRPGRPAKDVDKVARDHIQLRGYGRQFTHSTGHGVGLNIHENPKVSSTSTDRLEAAQVITIEPGVYLAGQFGVRIEDLVVVGLQGPEVLTTSARELIQL